jgi:hypothetical protein
LKSGEFAQLEPVFMEMIKPGGLGDFATRRKAANDLLNKIREQVSITRNQQIIAAKIDINLLKDIGIWSSKTGFSAEGVLPLPLFSKIEHVDRLLPEQLLTITKVNKARYTDPPLEDPPYNEREWFDDTFKRHVALRVLERVLAGLPFDIVGATSPGLFWENIQKYAAMAAERRLHPLLFVANSGDPEWLYDWCYKADLEGTPRPPDMRVRQKEQMPDGYIFNLNDVEVYQAPISPGASYLMMKESLPQVRFHRYENERFVEATIQEINDNPLLVDLRLAWQMDIQLNNKLPALKMLHQAAKSA